MTFTDSFTLKQKLIGAFSVTSLILLSVGGLSYWALKNTTREYQTIPDTNLPKTVILGDMRGAARNGLSDLLQLALPGNDEKEKARLSEKVNGAVTKYAELEKKFLELPSSESEKQLYQTLSQKWDVVEGQIKKNLPLALSASDADRASFADNYRGKFKEERHEFYQAMDTMIAFQRSEAQTASARALALADRSSQISLLLVTGGFILSIALGWLIAARLTRSLSRLADLLASGADSVSSNSQGLLQSSESLTSSVSEQAAALQETSASVDELTAIVQKNATNATQSKQASETSNASAQQGKRAVEDMVAAMSEIGQSNTQIMEATERSNRSISEITQVINDIAAKTKVINDIVFQTKLLSFNASVEAARAGEMGKGFAVVAEEVGSLAQMSGNAAHEISSMLNESIQKVEAIVSKTQQEIQQLIACGKEKVERGQQVAQRCGHELDEVTGHVARVNLMVSEIANASGEQAKGIQEITRAMHQMDQVTQRNSAASHQTSTSAGELASQAQMLRDVARDLRGTIYGAGASMAEAMPVEAPRAYPVPAPSASKPPLRRAA